MASSDLLDLADQLYALPLGEFTVHRDARAKELKASDQAGDKELATKVKALKKPSIAAWVVNLLVRREAAQVEQVLGVGAALREAQANLDGDELRALTRQRRQLTAAVTTRARGLAAEEGHRVTEQVAEQVEATLTAAMVDEGAAKAVRSGLLIGALAATGVDEVEVQVAVPEALGFAARPTQAAEPHPPELHVVPDPDADEKAIAAAEERLAEADAEVVRATQALEEAATEASDLEARSLQLQAEIEELRRRLDALESSSEEVDDELSDAEDVQAEAQRAVREAGRAREAAAAALARLTN